jgi:uncharacterized protein YecE (DUF72 family)
MEFGKVEDGLLEDIDFSLPADRAETTAILKTNKQAAPTKFYVGCAKWGRKDWVGKIYPKGTKEGDFLSHYGRYFNGIELNATYYKMPTYTQTSAWRSKVGNDFKFCPKFTESITHRKRLKDVDELLNSFFDGISGFGNQLGPVFLMPHPGMSPKALSTFETFIQLVPKDVELFVELRHPQFYSDESLFNETYSMLQQNNVGAIITDASGRRDCVHMRLTKPEAFIRFVGNGLHPSDYTRIDDWVQRIKKWMTEGIHTVYFFMHQHEEVHSPALIKYLIQELNKHCQTNIPVPVFVSDTMLFFGNDENPTSPRKMGKKKS